MRVKALLGFLLVFTFLISSCYPELSIQQYDRLREDLETMDVERHELRTKNDSLETELVNIKAKNQEIRNYIEFMYKMISTQSSAKILEGEFDVESLITSKDELNVIAEELEDGQIIYFMSLMNPENESQTVSAYYKIVEYCVKEIKQNLD
ncbi:hypothetical protein ACFLWR_01690 [Chloroflexota bacterium]